MVFALADLQGAARFAVSQTPVVLLAPEDAQWDGADVTVVNRRTDAAVLAVVIRRVSAGGAAKSDTELLRGDRGVQ